MGERKHKFFLVNAIRSLVTAPKNCSEPRGRVKLPAKLHVLSIRLLQELVPETRYPKRLKLVRRFSLGEPFQKGTREKFDWDDNAELRLK